MTGMYVYISIPPTQPSLGSVQWQRGRQEDMCGIYCDIRGRIGNMLTQGPLEKGAVILLHQAIFF